MDVRGAGEGEAPSTESIWSDELERSGAFTLDDVLRRVPGFTLFRRAGSRTANPTTQGVSLRGVGASGASRALVLDDGVPLMDPFGSWVPWNRVPTLALHRAIVQRGGGSDLWGSGAMGGVVRLERRRPEGEEIHALASWDSLDSPSASLFASEPIGRVHLDALGDAWRTGGYVPTAKRERGDVDVKAWSRHSLGEIGVRSDHWLVRLQRFDESRGNGTPLTDNSTNGWSLVASGSHAGRRSAFEWSADAMTQDYAQTFSAIAADRASEQLTREQSVPSDMEGVHLQWARDVRGVSLAAGFEARRRAGRSDETNAVTGAETSAGATQLSEAAWMDALGHPSAKSTLRGSLRLERWTQSDGRRVSAGVATALSDRTDSVLVPRLTFTRSAGEHATWSASAWTAFRTPTLNELYRDFRVGNVLTRANDALKPEHALGGEASWSCRGRVPLTATAFWIVVSDAIGNVTLSTTPTLIERRRENSGDLRSRGVEMDLDAPLPKPWSLRWSASFTDSRVVSSDAGLEGKRTPQVPRMQSSVRLAREAERWWASIDARWSSSQAEDDLNTLRLAPALVLDAAAGWRVARSAWIEAAVENALDEDVESGRTPVTTLAAPRTVRIALRIAKQQPSTPAH